MHVDRTLTKRAAAGPPSSFLSAPGRAPRRARSASALTACAFALLGGQTGCGDDDTGDPRAQAGSTGAAGMGAGGVASGGVGGANGAPGGPGVGQGGAGAGGQGGGPPGFAPPNAAAAPLVEALTRALSQGDEAALGASLGPTAFYVDALGRAEAPSAAAALLAGGPWALASQVDSHHDVFRAGVRKRDVDHVLFGALDGEGRAAWIALAAPPPADVAATSSIVKAYQDAWNVGDAARGALIAQSWSPSARYVDPTADVSGPGGLDATIVGFRSSLPGASIVPASGALEAQGLVHFRWRVEGGGGPPIEGMDVGFAGPGGALTLIAGFFGPLRPR